MRTLLAILVVGGVLGAAVFSIPYMHDEGERHASGCIAAASYGVDCPDGAQAAEFASFHFGALRNLAPAPSAAASAAFVAFLALAIGVGVLVDLSSPRALRRPAARVLVRLREEFTSWLALHENSPAAI